MKLEIPLTLGLKVTIIRHCSTTEYSRICFHQTSTAVIKYAFNVIKHLKKKDVVSFTVKNIIWKISIIPVLKTIIVANTPSRVTAGSAAIIAPATQPNQPATTSHLKGGNPDPHPDKSKSPWRCLLQPNRRKAKCRRSHLAQKRLRLLTVRR
jgi:hypothetical protein